MQFNSAAKYVLQYEKSLKGGHKMKTLLIGIGAAGNKAVMTSINMGIVM